MFGDQSMLTGDQARYDRLYRLGCICCRKLGYPEEPSQLHHQLSGTHRIGNEATVPLCPWHHEGLWKGRFRSARLAATLLGPSFKTEPKRFRERFGEDRELLEEVNELIKDM